MAGFGFQGATYSLFLKEQVLKWVHMVYYVYYVTITTDQLESD
jgi:hypothetical protein